MIRLARGRLIGKARQKLGWLRIFPFLTLLMGIRHSKQTYDRIFHFWYRLYCQSWYQALFLRQQTRQLSEFYQEIEPQLSLKEACALQGLGQQFSRGYKKAKAGAAFTEVIQIQGLDNLELARCEGAILASAHLFMSRYMVRACQQRLDGLEYFTINKGSRQRVRAQYGLQSAEEQQQQMKLLRTRDLVNARKVLNKGGIVTILADGRKGLPSEATRFLKRERPFAEGMGQLAAFSGKPVLLLDCHLHKDGSIRGEIQAVTRVSGEKSASELSQYYTGEYARWLENVWQNHPESVKAKHIRRYLDCPITHPEWVLKSVP